MQSKFNTLFQLIMEQLNTRQKQLVDKYVYRQQTGLQFGPVFAKLRTYFPLQNKVASNVQPSQAIKFFLDEAGYYVTDYRAGIAMKKSKTGEPKDLRPIKIGKIFQKLGNKHALKEFNERLGTSKKNIMQIKFQLCVTHDPYDVAGMSTDRNWTSCMQLDNGAYKETPLKQVQYGGMCAYLINAEDKNIEQPYARIAIKRLVSKNGNFIFASENNIYGDVDLANELNMNEELIKILNSSNQQTGKDDYQFYRDDDDSYSDSSIDTIYHFDKENKVLDNYDYYELQYMLKEEKLKQSQINYMIKRFKFTKKNIQFWKLVCAHVQLSLEFLRKYKDEIQWNEILKFYNVHTRHYLNIFSEDVLYEFKDYVNWVNICVHCILSNNFLIKMKPYIKNNIIFYLTNHGLSNEILQFYQDILNQKDWNTASSLENLSEENIIKFQDKINWLLLSYREVSYSTKFLEIFKDKLDWKKLFIYARLTPEQVKEFQKFSNSKNTTKTVKDFLEN